MLRVKCPHCGLRPEIEFHYGSEAGIARPHYPFALSDDAWAEYLFYRTSPLGSFAERWLHVHGCGRWFDARRNTLTDKFEDET